ncbi:DUF1801 domain-containing protein [bacterium]|nr:DUF1801 domain-containing protein [bacterium]
MPNPKITTIDSYIAQFPPDVQERLQAVRKLIRETEPEAQETISYQMAAFRLHGYMLIYFSGYDNYIGMYPAPINDPNFKADLSAYASGKATLRFPHDQPLPTDLIRQIVSFRAEQNAAKSAGKRAKKA